MNTDNLKQQQPLFREPAFIDGTAGIKQNPGEPQFVTGKATETLTPLYADQTRPDPYHAHPGLGEEKSLPVYGENKAPIYADQVSSTHKLYPGQENFVGQQIKNVDGKEVLTTGGVVQAAYVPPTHGEHKTEHVEERKTEHLHLNPSQPVQLPPNAEHVHIKADQLPPPGVEQVIRIKPDGQIHVTTEKVGEHHDTEHLKKEHDTVKEKEHIKTKKVSKKKKHVEEKVKHEVPVETTTVVKVIEHDGTAGGYDKDGKLGKHDDKHHHGTDDKHHHGTDDTHHHGTDDKHHGLFGKKDHVDDTHHDTDDKHHHGLFGKLGHHDETKVVVDKTQGSPDHVKVTTEEHGTDKHLKSGKTDKKKRLSGKKHKGEKSKHHGTDKPHHGKEILE